MERKTKEDAVMILLSNMEDRETGTEVESCYKKKQKEEMIQY